MKTTITTLLILLTLSGFTQPLMIGFRKADVIATMHRYPEYTRTVTAQDYIEYQHNDRAYGFRFEFDSLNLYYGRWHCSEFYVTMPKDQEQSYFAQLNKCNCLQSFAQDRWIWVTKQETITVEIIRDDRTVTVVYW